MATLIVTNGTSAVASIRGAGIVADMCPWNDVLHEGPVPAAVSPPDLARLRARHFASLGWGAEEEIGTWFDERDARVAAAPNFDEVVLWFEHDLYDQLQLVQLLDRLQPLRANVSVIQHRRFVGESAPDVLVADFASRHAATPDEYACAALAWAAFRSSTPSAAVALVASGRTEPLPFLRQALVRWFETFPAREGGLSRTEREVLLKLRDEAATAADLFRATSAAEEAPFRGDWSFWRLLSQLSYGDAPLVETEAGPYDPAEEGTPTLYLTELGAAVLDGRADRIAATGIDDWRGGIQLRTADHWRYDPEIGFERRRT